MNLTKNRLILLDDRLHNNKEKRKASFCKVKVKATESTMESRLGWGRREKEPGWGWVNC
jgi:hypothetical protein